jgi:CheY-like chemotaxis protein
VKISTKFVIGILCTTIVPMIFLGVVRCLLLRENANAAIAQTSRALLESATERLTQMANDKAEFGNGFCHEYSYDVTALRQKTELTIQHFPRLTPAFLQDLMEAVGLPAGGVAHDFNNLLTPILRYSELVLLDKQLPENFRKPLREIGRAGTRAKNLVRELMAFGRQQTLEVQPLDLNRVIEGFADRLRSTLRENVQIKYTVRVASGPRDCLDTLIHQNGHIDLFVADVIMPEMSGREWYRRLAVLRPGLKVLYMSGYTVDSMAAEGLIEGNALLVKKPFSQHELATKVRVALDSVGPLDGPPGPWRGDQGGRS